MSTQELPSGGGAYERKADGTLHQVEPPTAPQGLGVADPEAVEAPVEGAVERPAKRAVKEA